MYSTGVCALLSKGEPSNRGPQKAQLLKWLPGWLDYLFALESDIIYVHKRHAFFHARVWFKLGQVGEGERYLFSSLVYCLLISVLLISWNNQKMIKIDPMWWKWVLFPSWKRRVAKSVVLFSFWGRPIMCNYLFAPLREKETRSNKLV